MPYLSIVFLFYFSIIIDTARQNKYNIFQNALIICKKGGLGLKDYIKKESFYAISRIIFELTVSGVSRKEIAERCNFSQMTAGKVVSLLAQKGLISQTRSERSKGRHAQLVAPSDRKSVV